MPLHIHNRQRTVAIHTPLIRKCVQQVMEYTGCVEQEISVVFASDRLMQQLNRTYRGQDRPTNVLAFPQGATYDGEPMQPLLLGDVIVALPTAMREARAQRQSLETYVVYLLIHGLLHLLGYDHECSRTQRRHMEKYEQDILRHLREQGLLPSAEESLEVLVDE